MALSAQQIQQLQSKWGVTAQQDQATQPQQNKAANVDAMVGKFNAFKQLKEQEKVKRAQQAEADAPGVGTGIIDEVSEDASSLFGGLGSLFGAPDENSQRRLDKREAMRNATTREEKKALREEDPSAMSLGEIGKSVVGAVTKPVTALEAMLEAIPAAARLTKGAITGEGVTQEDISQVKGATKEGQQGIVSGLSLVPLPSTQAAAGVAEKVFEGVDKGQTLGEMAGRAGVQAVENVALLKAVEKVFTKPKKPGDYTKTPEGVVEGPSTTRARLSGMTNQDIDAVVNSSGVSKPEALKLLKQAQKAAASRGEKGAIETVGEDFSKGLTKLDDAESAIGKEIGKEAAKLKGKNNIQIDVAPIYNKLVEDMGKMNVKFKGLAADYADSSIAGLSTDQKILNDLMEFTQPGADGVRFANLADLRAKIQNTRNLMQTALAKGELTQSQAIAEAARTGMRGKLYGVRGKLGELATKYAQLDEFLTEAGKATKDGIRTPEFLRRAFSNTGSFPNDLLERMHNISETFGVKEGKNLFEKANLALTAENAAGYVAPTGLKGSIPMTKQGIAGKILDKGLEKVTGNQVENFLRLLNTSRGEVTPSLLKQALGDAADTEFGRALLQTFVINAPKSINEGD